MVTTKPFAFVLMPFSNEFNDVYKIGIKRTCEAHGVIAERVDEQIYSEQILERIYRQIENADFIIADMTGKNPNVFYEVGYAHAKEKMCALITQKADDIPFDLRHHPHIIYGGQLTLLQEQLGPRLDWMKQQLETNKSKGLEVTEVKPVNPTLEVTEYRRTGVFDLKVTIKNAGKTRSPEIDTVFVIVSDSWTATFNGKECASDIPEEGKRRLFIPPANSRLSPNALTVLEIALRKEFWSKWSGSELKESYRARGRVIVELGTSEGTLPFEFDLDITFDEIPF